MPQSDKRNRNINRRSTRGVNFLMSKDLYENKKHISDAPKIWLLALILCAMSVSFGYCRGVDKVQDEAVDLGYGEMVKGEFMWNSARKIGMGIK